MRRIVRLTVALSGASAILLAWTALEGPRERGRSFAPATRGGLGGAQTVDPIAYVGHGALFDASGRQLTATPQLVARAQAHYGRQLRGGLRPEDAKRLDSLERAVRGEEIQDPQARLLVENEVLRWMLRRVPAQRPEERTARARLGMKLNALRYAMTWALPPEPRTAPVPRVTEFKPSPKVLEVLKTIGADRTGVVTFALTANRGQAYIDECRDAGVPIPPPIGQLDPAGTSGWRSMGFIPQTEQFIVGSPAEVRVFRSTAPDGMCVALPRYTDATRTTVMLDGVICLGRTTSRMCMWDNQMDGATFAFPAGAVIPIGVPNLAINPAGLYQAGGAELEEDAGGMCTNCHAGQNPYIVHPNSNLGPLVFGALNLPPNSLPTFSAGRYVPLAPASWVQNERSMAPGLVPAACVGCHSAGGYAGALPHLSQELGPYCRNVLAPAIARTMPPSAPGSEAANPAVVALRNWCDVPAAAGSSDRGDPHLATVTNVRYDFQAAGEFTALRNSGARFEIQTRQTPVSTSFVPPADAHTGVASCPSLNTAVAMRLGAQRVTYQQAGRGTAGRQPKLVLRLDGNPVTVPAGGLGLADGSRIVRADTLGAITVRAADGTRVIVTPQFWASQGYWYLDVDVLNTPAREGILGGIVAPNWLPLGPNAEGFGAAPASAADRALVLNRRFADAWRVRDSTTLFDYEPGTSTKTFTDRRWPPPPGAACVGSPVAMNGPVRPMRPELARQICGDIRDSTARRDCVFDAMAMGNAGVAAAYRRALALRAAAGGP